MPFCLGQIFAPRIEAVASDEKTVCLRVTFEDAAHCFGEGGHVLRVFDDRQPLGVLMRSHAIKAFQHFVAFDLYPALGCVDFGEDRVPYRMSVKHCSRAALLYDTNMEGGFV